MKTKSLSRLFAFATAVLTASTAMAAPAGLEKMFQRIDADRDGSVTPAELTAHYSDNIKSRAKSKGWSEAVVAMRLESVVLRVAEEMKRMDTDENEQLSLEEFAAGRSKK